MDRGISIRSMDDVERFARIAAASGLLSVRKPEEAMVILLTGQELGLSPMQSLRGIYVVNNRPVLSADMLVAVVRSSGLCESWRVVEATPARCTITTRRRGETQDETATWTIEDAKRASLGGANWTRYPMAMLRARCSADLARRVYPDAALGLYVREEMTAEGEPADEGEEPVRVRMATYPSPAGMSPTQMLPPPPAYPAWEAFCADVASVTTCAHAAACWSLHAAALYDEAEAQHERGGRYLRDHLEALGYVFTSAHATAVLGGTLSPALAAVYDALAVVALREGDDDHSQAVADVAVVLRAHRGAPEHEKKEMFGAGRRRLGALGMPLDRAAAQLRAALTPPTPPTGTDGPARGAEGDATAQGTGVAAETSAAPVALVPEWARTREAMEAHVAGYTHPRAVENAVRKHARTVGPAFVALCAARLVALGTSEGTAGALVAAWQRPAQQRRAA